MSINKTRITAEQAGYLELPDAVKDADCEIVEVEGGVSSERGCCNSYGWRSANPKGFSCGECKYVEGASDQPEENRPLGKKEARGMSFKDILESQRPVLEGRE